MVTTIVQTRSAPGQESAGQGEAGRDDQIWITVQQLERLIQRRTEATQHDDAARIKELNLRIAAQRRRVEQLVNRYRDEIEQQRDALLSEEALERLHATVREVAEREGYNVIVRSDDPNLQWWSDAVDITEMVLEALREDESSRP